VEEDDHWPIGGTGVDDVKVDFGEFGGVVLNIDGGCGG
jgi:hypothetical protein